MANVIPYWLKPELSDVIMKGDDPYKQMTNIIADLTAVKLDISNLVENMQGVLTDKDPENREKGMKFFTKLLKDMPKNFLNENQIKFISKFYIDRLKDNHRVIPAVLEGYISIVDMQNYIMEVTSEFFSILFREVNCQSQVRQDRYHIYLIVKKLLAKDLNYMTKLGPDFIYGFITAMDGERDPRNLIFLFEFLPNLVSNVPLGNLVEEMFEVISCYYPIDFHPSPDDPAAVSRDELANALAPCLCAVPEFAEHCLVLLIEKLDSSLRLAKLDSLRLLKESTATFRPDSYEPFLKALWSSLYREINHKTDDELKMSAHQSLHALVKKLSTTSNTDQVFENFVKGILISMQSNIAEASTVAQFSQTSRILLTTANASKESCLIITRSMVPAIATYYGLSNVDKLQLASLEFLSDLYEMAKHWEVLNEIENQLKEIPQLCLTAVSKPDSQYQIAGFKTLIRVIDVLTSNLVVPFVEVLIYNIQNSKDEDLLKYSIETVHAIARKYPQDIMQLVVKGKCNLNELPDDNKALQKRLNLLSNLASIDDFTKTIVEDMLQIVNKNNNADKVLSALNECMSDTSLYSESKLTQIESDHGLIASILNWLLREITNVTDEDSLEYGYNLVAATVASLPEEKQLKILDQHTKTLLQLCETNKVYFHVLEALYDSLHVSVTNDYFEEILVLALNICIGSGSDSVRRKASVLIAHFLNKADLSNKFESLYGALKNTLSSCNKADESLCMKLIPLYGWIAKALILRGSDYFMFWLQKIMVSLSSPAYCNYGAESIKLIMTDNPKCLTVKQHCRVSLLYKQRMFQTFSSLTEKVSLNEGTKEAYFMCWAHLLGNVPKTVLGNYVDKIVPLVIQSLEYDNRDLLLVMVDVLCHIVQTNRAAVGSSLQTILPRLLVLSTYVKSMDVRIKSLRCLYEIADCYPTVLLLPYKQDVQHDLAPSLDDKKRLVRNMAVKARTRWFLIGAPGEAKEN